MKSIPPCIFVRSSFASFALLSAAQLVHSATEEEISARDWAIAFPPFTTFLVVIIVFFILIYFYYLFKQKFPSKPKVKHFHMDDTKQLEEHARSYVRQNRSSYKKEVLEEGLRKAKCPEAIIEKIIKEEYKYS